MDLIDLTEHLEQRMQQCEEDLRYADTWVSFIHAPTQGDGDVTY